MDGADGSIRNNGANSVDAHAMGQIDMMNGLQMSIAVGDSRRSPINDVAKQRKYGTFVEGSPALNPVAVAPRDRSGVVGKPISAIAVGPATLIIQRLR